MPNKQTYQKLWDERERYALTAPRYLETSSLAAVGKLLKHMSQRWKTNRNWIDYVDLGCSDCRGTQLFSDFLNKTTNMPVKAIGIDASAKCEALCRNRNVEFRCLELGAEAIPLRDCHIVTLFDTIEHVFDTDFLLESIRDCLSKDGVLLVTTMNVVNWKNRILVPLGIQPINTEVSTRKLNYGFRIRSLKKRVDKWIPAGHIRPFTLFSLQDMLEDNRFTVISSHGLENWRPFKFLEFLAKNMCTGILVIARPS